MSDNKIHTFEESGLGKAPFQVVSYRKNEDGGGCRHCGTAIVHEFYVESADGKQSKVGSSCVKKTGDAGLIDQAKRAKRLADAQAREAERQQRREEKLTAEREANGGLTDEELDQKNVAEDRDAFLAALGDDWQKQIMAMADDLRDGQYGFRDAMADDLEKLILPSGSKQAIVVKVLTKHRHSNPRQGSKKYQEAFEIESNAYEELRTSYLECAGNLKPRYKQQIINYGLGVFSSADNLRQPSHEPSGPGL